MYTHFHYKTKHRKLTFSSSFNVDSTIKQKIQEKAPNMLENPESFLTQERNKFVLETRISKSADFSMFYYNAPELSEV